MKNSLLLLLPLMFFLTLSCAPVITDDDQTADLSSLHDRRTPEAVRTDKKIESKINDELNDDDDIVKQCHINTTVYNAAVLVTGEAPNEELKNRVISLIRIIAHVKLVHDHLTIAYPSSLDSRSNDEMITDRIKSALAQIRTFPEFDSSLLKVVTEDATVYLMGLVHREEGAVVINVVRHQPDVKKIVTVFEYLD
jgi:osmotically-inducible protein OsmY